MLLHCIALALALVGADPDATAAPNPPLRALRVSAVEGATTWHTPADAAARKGRINDVLSEGDTLETSDEARVEVDLGPVAVRVAPHSRVVFAVLSDTRLLVELQQGSVLLQTIRVPQDQTVAVHAENAALEITAIGEYRVSLDAHAHRASVLVRDGAANLALAQSQHPLARNESVQLSRTEAPVFADASSRDAFDAWCDSRRQTLATHAVSRYVSNDVVGWQDLEGHGKWTDTDDGPAWQPTDVARDWAPYTQGQWAWSDVYGWTWVDDAAWNYAPSHYGRWGYYEDAWMWVPGPAATAAVYSPALVAFIDVNAFADGLVATWNYASWFALGPGEPYLPGYHTTDWYIERMNTGIPLDVVPYSNRSAPHAVVAVRDKVLQAGAPIAPARQALSAQAREYAPAVAGFSAIAPREADAPHKARATHAATFTIPAPLFTPPWAQARRTQLVQTFRAQAAQPLYHLPTHHTLPRGRDYFEDHRVPRPSVGSPRVEAPVEAPQSGGFQHLPLGFGFGLGLGLGVGGFNSPGGGYQPRPVGPGPQQTQHPGPATPAAPQMQPRGPMPTAPHAFGGHR